MLSINTNLSSLIVQNNLTKSTNGLNQAIERMTTGFKINHASDNAAGYSIAQNMTSKLNSYEVAQDNVSMGMDLISTAADSLDLISTHLQRIRDLAEQAANGTYGAQSLQAIQSEVDARVAEINRVVANTEYNGIQLFDGAVNPVETLQPNERGFLRNVSEVDVSGYTRVSELDGGVTSISSGTYAITTKEDLLRLDTMSEITGGTFILGTDIDMDGETLSDGCLIGDFYNATFNGNGHTISNMSGGLFCDVDNSTIENLGLINSEVSDGFSPIAFQALDATISNCYVDGGYISQGYFAAGGLVAGMTGTMEYCWSDIDINIGEHGFAAATGGLIGYAFDLNNNNLGTVNISNSFSKGNVRNNCVDGDFAISGGLIGIGVGSITNCYASGEVSSVTGQAAGLSCSPQGFTELTGDDAGDFSLTISNSLYAGTSSVDAVRGEYHGSLLEPSESSSSGPLTLQVGVNGDSNSQISVNTGFSISLSIDVSSNSSAVAALSTIDNYINQVSEKQTHLGAAYNRLESALDSIGVSINNLTSSRSTLRDADIAKESSQYIKNQILQQAAATLLATANQTPSIALQLL